MEPLTATSWICLLLHKITDIKTRLKVFEKLAPNVKLQINIKKTQAMQKS